MAPDSINITPIARRRNRAGAGWGRLRACQQGEIVFSSNLRDSRNFPVQRPFDFSAGLALATISRRCLRLGVSQSFSLGSRVLSNASISSIASVDDVPHARHVACDRAVEGGDEAQFWNEGRDFAAHEECCGHAVPSGKMRLKNVVRLLPKPRGSRLWRGLLWVRGGLCARLLCLIRQTGLCKELGHHFAELPALEMWRN